MRRLVAIGAALALAQACAHVGASLHPLYGGPPRPANEVAILSGPIATVDGIDVSDRAFFSLLPGCHVVVLQSSIGEGGVSGAWSADIPRHVYAFRMTAGHSYVIKARLLPGNHGVGTANVGGVQVTAVEQDSEGNKIGKIKPARSEADIASCQAWGAALEDTASTQPPEEPAPQPKDGGQPPEPGDGGPQPETATSPDAGPGDRDTQEPAANPIGSATQ
jgi:hypothetical protein